MVPCSSYSTMSDEKKPKRAAESEAEGDSKEEKKTKKAKTEKKPKAKKADTHQLNANKAVDKKHEGKKFS
jgi:hypothetical protein